MKNVMGWMLSSPAVRFWRRSWSTPPPFAVVERWAPRPTGCRREFGVEACGNAARGVASIPRSVSRSARRTYLERSWRYGGRSGWCRCQRMEGGSPSGGGCLAWRRPGCTPAPSHCASKWLHGNRASGGAVWPNTRPALAQLVLVMCMLQLTISRQLQNNTSIALRNGQH